MDEEKIIIFGDPTSYYYDVTGCKYYVTGSSLSYSDIHEAMYTACTHIKCPKCDHDYEKFHKICPECYKELIRIEYMSYPVVEWDGSLPVCIMGNPVQRFFTYEQVYEYANDYKVDVKDLLLILCKKIPFKHIELENIIPVPYLNPMVYDKIEFLIDCFNLQLEKIDTGKFEEDKIRVRLKGENYGD